MSSLDNLKKEAKRWLKAIRAGDAAASGRLTRAYPDAPAEPGIRDVLHALAREHGHKNWAALTNAIASEHATPAAPPPSPRAQEVLEQLKSLAKTMVIGYETGDAAAMQRIASRFGRALTWPDFRTEVRNRVAPAASSITNVEFGLAEARTLLARNVGFTDWASLAKALETGTAPANRAYILNNEERRIQPQRLLVDADWDVLIDVMKQQQITGFTSHGQMTDDILQRMSALDQITRLDLSGSREITDEGVRFLARLRHLTHLNLSGCKITDRGLDVLRELPQLQTFQLYHQPGITDAGIANLRGCDHLEFVDLMGTQTGDEAIKALTGKPKLRKFHAGTRVTDAGLAMFNDFPVFKTWQGHNLDASFLGFDAEPNFLFLNLKSPITDTGLAHLAHLDGLVALSLFATTGHAPFDDSKSVVTAAGVRHLTGLSHLGWLGCCARLASDDTMQAIAAMPQLRFLSCQDAIAGDEGFVALGRSSSIENIWGRRCHNLQGRGFAALANMPVLRALSVSCKNVDEAGLSALPRFPALKEFMPMDVPDEGFRHIGQCRHLEELICMGCRGTTDRATEHLKDLHTLKRYYAGSTQITDASLEMLAHLPSLEIVQLHDCKHITDAGVAALVRLPRLREVELNNLPRVTAQGSRVFPAQVRVAYSP